MEKSFAGATLTMAILGFFVLLIFFVVVITLIILLKNMCLTKCGQCGRKIWSYFWGMLFYNSILRAVLESYLLLSLNTLFEVFFPKFDTVDESVNFGLGVAILIFLIAFPVIIHRCLLRKQAQLGE